MIFSRIFEDLWNQEHTREANHLAMRVKGAPPASWAHGGPPPLIPAPIHFIFFQKKSPLCSNPCSCSSCCHFQSPCSKLHSQNCFGGIVLWYVTPPMVQLAFFLVFHSLQIFAVVVTLFLSLHVKLIWSKVVLMHDMASRH